MIYVMMLVRGEVAMRDDISACSVGFAILQHSVMDRHLGSDILPAMNTTKLVILSTTT
jgi:hypothetical protein